MKSFKIIYEVIKLLFKENLFIIKQALKAKNIDEAIKSYKIVKKEYPHLDFAIGIPMHKWGIACYNQDANKIIINVIGDFWQNKQEYLLKKPIDLFSSDSQNHIFYHEVGHYLHLKKIKYEKVGELQSTIYKDKDFIRKNVSYHATFNQLEFVAEVFAGMKSGKVYCKDIMDRYRFLNGPEKHENN